MIENLDEAGHMPSRSRSHLGKWIKSRRSGRPRTARDDQNPSMMGDVLQAGFSDTDATSGLHYVAFLVREDKDHPQGWSVSTEAVNGKAIQISLRLIGMDHSFAQQVHEWRNVIPMVHNSFENLERTAAQNGIGSQPKVTRLVLDVEGGGLFYAPVLRRGSVFAATLSQQAMHKGSAEKAFLSIVRELEVFLESNE